MGPRSMRSVWRGMNFGSSGELRNQNKRNVALAGSDDPLSREILETVAQLLIDPLRNGSFATAHR